MADPYASGMSADSADMPARLTLALVPSDVADLADIPKALWIAAAGTLTIIGVNDVLNTGTQMGTLTVGTVVPVRCRRVRSTGTTATVIGLY